jgi:DEAD/DEAH box helicase
MEVFEECAAINDLLESREESAARDRLIKLLAALEAAGTKYSALVNHLIRQVGLFPYLEPESAAWQDRFAYESFKVDVGSAKPITMHSEQSLVLKNLLEGTNLAISAPTSFGKSLIIDAYIAIRRPKNVLIIVPTIALTDETRRRLQRKFSNEYKVITTADVPLSERNILIFPQERAIQYSGSIESIDLLVIDEFYKASQEHDKERAPALLKAMLLLGARAKQKYYLAPNISDLSKNEFTSDMKFLRLDFNTVFLEKHDLYKHVGRDAQKKSDALLEIILQRRSKSLIYVGTYSNVERVSGVLVSRTEEVESPLLLQFAAWLSANYDPTWSLVPLVKRGSGVHTGQLHRSLAQIQVKLFEEDVGGLDNLISTSSIIEGVNTSAENVIVWSNKNGSLNLNDFTYKNIIGRGGRMFRHFVGNIYLLEEPPLPHDTQLDLTFPDELLADVDTDNNKAPLTKEQLAKLLVFKEDMAELLGEGVLERLRQAGVLMSGDLDLLRLICSEIATNRRTWRGLKFLNGDDTEKWEWILGKVLKLTPGSWDAPYQKFIKFVRACSENWSKSIPEILEDLDEFDISIEQFFKMEKNATYKLAALLNDVNALQKEIIPDERIDISPFIARLSRAFLPSCVMDLEEYGLPRMLSRKIAAAGIVDFSGEDQSLDNALTQLKASRSVIVNLPNVDAFDRYILDYFFDGIELDRPSR